MKTPEEMAMEYINDVETPRNPSVAATAFPQMQRCFLAGYKAAQQWISVKDRLPRPGQEVLVFDNGIMRVQAISDHGTWHPYVNGARCNPSHWIELPAPPEEK